MRVRIPVLIVGGGPVGLAVAALLARHGVRSLTVEADPGWCEGSRAICISRRSLEILAWSGADRPLLEKALPWSGGRSFFRDAEVLRFEMPTEPTQRFAPMVNIQQYYVEQFLHGALDPACGTVRHSTRLCALRPGPTGVEADVLGESGCETVQAEWLIACDGGRSTVREILGLKLEGTQYEGRYIIVDIQQDTARRVERLAWFDPPSNPGSTILMHRQPDNIWRIDYQLREDEDPERAVLAENVLPRVQAHLDMIGERAPWKPLWISIYNAKCLTLPAYRAGRVLFAGDAAHLVPIFGVRGLNSGLEDAGNLAWKLACVLRGGPAALLDSYSHERVGAARENIAQGAKSTEFMAPPHHGFALMREAALRLALCVPEVRSLINPRQTAPLELRGSALNLPDRGMFSADARSGMPAPEAKLRGASGPVHLSSLFGAEFTALLFSDRGGCSAMLEHDAGPIRWVRIARRAQQDPSDGSLEDAHGEAWHRYDAAEGTLYLIRPDGYIMGRWRDAMAEARSPGELIARALEGTI